MAQTFSGRPLIVLELLTSSSANQASNNTTVSWTLQARETASQPSFGLTVDKTASVSFSVSGGSITSTTYTFGTNIPWSYDFRPTGLQTKVIGSGSFVVTHNTAGVGGTVSGSAAANDPSGVLGSADHSISFGLTDYQRLPTTPARPTITRNTDRTSITITGAVSTFFGSSPSYEYQISTNGGTTWSTAATLGAGRQSTLTVPNTNTYVARTRARDSEGIGAYSPASLSSAPAPSTPTVSVSRSGLVYTITGGSTITSGSVSSYELSHRSSVDGGTIYSDWSSETTVSGTTSYSTTFTSSSGTTYEFRVRARSADGWFSFYGTSLTVHTPAVPLIPETAISLSRNVRNVTIDWDAFRTTSNTISQYNGALITSYEVEERYSNDNGATWAISYTNITTTTSSTTVFLASNRLIAKTYQFRVRAVSDVGNSAYQESSNIFISAYGSRNNESGFVPIETAKIFLGVGEPGTDAAGWRTIENVKRFVGVGEPGADANGWTDLQT